MLVFVFIFVAPVLAVVFFVKAAVLVVVAVLLVVRILVPPVRGTVVVPVAVEPLHSVKSPFGEKAPDDESPFGKKRRATTSPHLRTLPRDDNFPFGNLPA